MSNSVQVSVPSILLGLSSALSDPGPVAAAADEGTSRNTPQDVYVPLGQGPDMKSASFHLNQFWTYAGQPVDMTTENQEPETGGQPPDMVSGQPVDM